MAAENYQPNAGIIHDDGCKISIRRGNSFYFILFIDSFNQTKERLSLTNIILQLSSGYHIDATGVQWS